MDLRKDIYFYADLASFPAIGAANLLYVDKSSGFIYTWDGSSYAASGAGGLKYGGLWNATTNNPTITSGVGDTGEYYIVGTAGTTSIDGISDWGVGDWIIFGGSAWQKIDNSEVTVATIYTADGTVSGNRTINLNGNTLRFSNGPVEFDQGSTNSGEIRLYEDSDAGSNKVILRAAQAMTSDVSFFFPASNGSNGNVLTTNGSGVTSWSAPSSSSGIFGIANASGVYTYYATLTLAMADATAGQTIEMFADVTETGAVTINLKNGVNINGNGHSYTLSNTGTVSCLSDNGVAVTCSITDLTVNRIGSTSQSTTNTTCLLVTGASRIDFNGSKAYASNATSVIVNNSGAIVSNVYAYGASGAQAATTIYVNAGRLENSTAYNNANNAGFFVYGLHNLGTIVNCIAHQTSGHPAILSSGIMIDCVGYSTSTGAGVRNAGIAIGSTGYSSGGAGFIADVNTTNQSCNGYSSGGRGFEISGSANCRVMNCSGFSTAGFGILAYNAFVQNSTAHSTSTNGLYLSNAGDGFGSISNCAITSDAAAALFCNPSSLMSVSNSTMLSRWNNAAGHAAVLGLTVFSGAPFVDFFNNTFIVSNASANCLNSANAVSVRYASSVFRNSTTAVNANITQLVTNTEDNQGNILI